MNNKPFKNWFKRTNEEHIEHFYFVIENQPYIVSEQDKVDLNELNAKLENINNIDEKYENVTNFIKTHPDIRDAYLQDLYLSYNKG